MVTTDTPVVEDTAATAEASVTEMPTVEMVAPVYETLENALVSANVVDPAEAPAAEPAVEATDTPAESVESGETPNPVESTDSVKEAVETAGEVVSHE